MSFDNGHDCNIAFFYFGKQDCDVVKIKVDSTIFETNKQLRGELKLLKQTNEVKRKIKTKTLLKYEVSKRKVISFKDSSFVTQKKKITNLIRKYTKLKTFANGSPFLKLFRANRNAIAGRSSEVHLREKKFRRIN